MNRKFLIVSSEYPDKTCIIKTDKEGYKGNLEVIKEANIFCDKEDWDEYLENFGLD